MTSYWVFQANPSMYDIDAALQQLDEIRWRVPQYTGAISPGDGVVIWRSGAEAGVVGVGRVAGYPGEMEPTVEDNSFASVAEADQATTRVVLRVAPAPFRPKPEIAALPGWSGHQVITAPMGTVFPITPQQWTVIAPLLPELPVFEPDAEGALPGVFAWEQRRKDTNPLPGGYDGYLDSLRSLVTEVGSSQPGRDDLVGWMVENWGVTETSARLGSGFLLRIGVLVEHGSVVEPSEIANRWLDDHDHTRLIALLHSRVRFIGELLAEAVEPHTDTELLEIANRYYDVAWQTKTQIRGRRGWLQSAGFLAATDDGRLQTTPAGMALVERLDLHPRSETVPKEPRSVSEAGDGALPPPPPSAAVLTVTDSVLALADRLRASGSDGQASEQFERETTEAFRRLGFRSEWRGGSGQTDVLLEADLGRDHSYRVVIDCKASSRGNISQQIDWDTIDEHRIHHHAQHAAIVAAGFGGGRLPDRAQRHDAVLLTVEDLVDLLVQHDRLPLGLDTYRMLFTSGTTEDAMAAIAEIAAEAERRVELMRAVVDQIRNRAGRMGALSARDLELLLSTSDELPDAVESEIAPVLDTIASPLLGILDKDERGAVRLRSSAASGAAMLRLLADALDPHADTEETPGT